ncbi:hypothetical protein [Rudaea sp.]|uniref:hypothetical protein n=1 Tax=Rudaea sp. TaxID=2136325 RepID=UPI002ED50C60
MNSKLHLVGFIALALGPGVNAEGIDHAAHDSHVGSGANEPSIHSKGESHVYAEREFSLDLPGTVAFLTPYFGPVKESEWSPDWKPLFVHPLGGGQIAGAIFQTRSEWGLATWVLDRYEPEHGKVGYLIFIAGIGVTRYDITLTQSNPVSVRVRVWCSRTALNGAGAKYVAQFEQSFASQGPEWQQAIRSILPH